jgi:hypothetical protein
VRRRGFHIFYTVGSQKAVRLSALRAGRPLPQEDPWYSFLLEAESSRPRAIVRTEGLSKLEKIHLIGKRSRDLPVCSIVPLRYRVPRSLNSTGVFRMLLQRVL